MEVALRRRLDGVANLAISQQQQTATVEFAAGARPFDARVMREAIMEAHVEVLALHADACGVIEEKDAARWLVGGGNRLRLEKAEAAPVGPVVCVSGTLDDQSDPYRLEVASITTS